MDEADIRPVIVLVHLGSRMPGHLPAQIRRLRRQGHDVIVAVDSAPVATHVSRHGASAVVVDVTAQRNLLAMSMGQRMAFRDGFWAQTALRLTALAQVHDELGQPVIHIENDVLLHPRLDTRRLVQSGHPLAWGTLAPGRDIAAILVTQDTSATAALAESVISDMLAAPDITEMHALAAFSSRRPADVELLPTSPSDQADFFMTGAPADIRGVLSRGAGAWSGVFDVAGFGQYLLGTDPRNRRGRYTLFTDPPDQWVRPSRFVMAADAEGWPVLEVGGESFTVWSLHVHSKDLRAFDEGQLRQLLANRIAGPRTPQGHHSPMGALNSARDAVRRRILIRSKGQRDG